MKLCMMTCMMDGYSPREIVETAVKCRMSAIDWISTHQTDPKVLKKLCDDAGLPIAAHTMIKTKFIERRPDYLDDFKASLEDCLTLGAPVLMLPPFARENQASLADDRKAYIEYYVQAYELAKDAGVTLTLESTGFGNSPITTAAEVLEVLQAVPGLKLTFDYGNVATADDPDAAYCRLHDYIVHFHLKDWHFSDQPQPDGWLARNGRYVGGRLMGTGDLDLVGFWAKVSEEHRQLPVNLESIDYTGKMTPAESMVYLADQWRDR